MQQAESIRGALYVLYARLFAGPPDAALYERLRGGLKNLADAQQVLLTADLVDESDAAASAAELGAEYERIARTCSMRASDYDAAGGAESVAAIGSVILEQGLMLDTDLPNDHLSVALGVMGALESDAMRAKFFREHLDGWWEKVLTDVVTAADRQFYAGLCVMVAAFLKNEAREYGVA